MNLNDIVGLAEPAYKEHVKMVQFIEGLYDKPKRPSKGLESFLYNPLFLISAPIKHRRIFWYMPRYLSLRGLLSGEPLVRNLVWKVKRS